MYLLTNVVTYLVFVVQIIFVNSNPTIERKAWFSKDGNYTCTLCPEGGIYQLNIEGDTSFLAYDYFYTRSKPEIDLVCVGPKKMISPTFYQQDVKVKTNDLGILTRITFNRNIQQGRNRTTISCSLVSQDGFMPVFLGYHCL